MKFVHSRKKFIPGYFVVLLFAFLFTGFTVTLAVSFACRFVMQKSMESLFDKMEGSINTANEIIVGGDTLQRLLPGVARHMADAMPVSSGLLWAAGIIVSSFLSLLLSFMISRFFKRLYIQSSEADKNIESSFDSDLRVREAVNLLCDLGHEMRTPLTVIGMHLEAMIDGVIEPDYEQLKNIKEETKRLCRLMNDLQSFVTEDVRFELRYDRHDINVIVNKVIDSFLAVCRERNIKINCRHTSVPCLIMCDEDKIIQALYNLVSNAVKYSDDFSGIDLEVAEGKETVSITVRDYGIGIPEEYMPNLFKRFYRVEAARSKKVEGSGLGLCIVKALVESHKGIVKVKSTYKGGSKFTIILPKNP